MAYQGGYAGGYSDSSLSPIDCDECNEPCNCVVADDGILNINGSYVVNNGRGRRNTVVSGSGSSSDPYTVSFIDSEFYRPESAEFTYPDQSVINDSNDLSNFTNGAATFLYESPGTFVFNVGAGQLGDFAAYGYFMFVGASAEFALNTTGQRKILITADDSLLEYVIAGKTSEAPDTESYTLTCSGFWPGQFFPGDSNVGFSTFRIRLFQNSGASMNVTNIKFWIGTL